MMNHLFSVAQHPKSDRGCVIVGVYRSHTIRHTKTHTHTHKHSLSLSLSLLWKSDQPVAEAVTYTTHNKHNRRISMSQVGFEPTIPEIKRLQTYASESAAKGIGNKAQCSYNLIFRTRILRNTVLFNTPWSIHIPLHRTRDLSRRPRRGRGKTHYTT
jgi:hypothetical protein